MLYIPTAGIETDGARESLAICFHELFLMGIQYENILVYNLELILSKDYQRTYSSYVTTPFMLTRLLTFEELNQFDAVFVSGGDVSVLCREMSRTGFDRILNNAIKNGLIYVGISAGSIDVYKRQSFAFGGEAAQEKLLQADGIEVVNGRVDLEKYQWKFK